MKYDLFVSPCSKKNISIIKYKTNCNTHHKHNTHCDTNSELNLRIRILIMNTLFMIHSGSFLGGPNTLMLFVEIVARHLVNCTDGHVKGFFWVDTCQFPCFVFLPSLFYRCKYVLNIPIAKDLFSKIGMPQHKQCTQKHTFAFVYLGKFNVKMWSERRDLGLRSIKLCLGTHGYWYAFMKIEKKKRANQIQKMFEKHDINVTDGMQIKVTNLPGESPIIEFGHGHEFMDHVIYKELEKAKEKKCSSYYTWDLPPNHNEGEKAEFDVVKKRRLMDSAPEDAVDDTEALSCFEDFEANVLHALVEIDSNDRQAKYNEMIEMEQDLCSGVQPTTGGVYVALSKAVKYPKIGATRRSHPSARLQELSRYVPSPFEAVFWVPTIVPFKTEADIHRHFAAFRIREMGACTEFFNVDIADVGKYLKANYQVHEREDLI